MPSLFHFRCESCDYITDREFNLVRHYTTTKHDLIIKQQQQQQQQMIKFTCDKCKRVFSRSQRLKEHYDKCEGASSLQCPVCFKTFNSKYGKYKHIKNIKCRPKDEVQLANFGNEDISGLLSDPMYMKKVEGCIRRFLSELPYLDEDAGKFIIPEITKEIYFNKNYPQNQTIRKFNKKNDIVKIHNNNVWENRVVQDVVKKLVVKTEQYFTPYVDNFVDKIEEKDKYGLNRTEVIKINNLRGFGNRMVWFNWDVGAIRDVNDKIDRSLTIPRIYTSDVNEDTKTQRRIIKNTSKQIAVDLYDATKNLAAQYRTPSAVHILTND